MRAKVGWGLVWGAVMVTLMMLPSRRAAAGNCALFVRAQTGVDLYGAAGGWWDEAASPLLARPYSASGCHPGVQADRRHSFRPRRGRGPGDRPARNHRRPGQLVSWDGHPLRAGRRRIAGQRLDECRGHGSGFREIRARLPELRFCLSANRPARDRRQGEREQRGWLSRRRSGRLRPEPAFRRVSFDRCR